MMQGFEGPAVLPARVRLFPLPGALLLPGSTLHLNIFEPRYLQMVRDAMADDRFIAMIQPRNRREPWDLFQTGCLGRITQYVETPDGRLEIVLSGLQRFQLVREVQAGTPYRQAEPDFNPFQHDVLPADALAAIIRADLEESLRAYLARSGMSAEWSAVQSADDENLVHTLCTACPFSPLERQALLEAPTLDARAATLSALMQLSEGGDDPHTMQ